MIYLLIKWLKKIFWLHQWISVVNLIPVSACSFCKGGVPAIWCNILPGFCWNTRSIATSLAMKWLMIMARLNHPVSSASGRSGNPHRKRLEKSPNLQEIPINISKLMNITGHLVCMWQLSFLLFVGMSCFCSSLFSLADSSNTGVKHSESSDHPLLLPCFDSAVSPPGDFSEKLGDSIDESPQISNCGSIINWKRFKKKVGPKHGEKCFEIQECWSILISIDIP